MPEGKVRLDLNSPVFQASFFALEAPELKQAVKILRKISSFTWDQLYGDQGLKWEEIKSAKGTYSFRVSQKVRAVASRHGDLMLLHALHTDHDGTYGKK